MIPVLLKIGPLTIYSYGFSVFVGVLTAVFLMRRCAAREEWTAEEMMDLMAWFVLSCFIGARILYVLQNAAYYAENPLKIPAVWEGGFIFYGGIFTGVAFLFFYSRRKNKSFLGTMDFVAPFVALTHGFGRIGCFLNGCCYGTRTDFPWSVHYPFLDHAVHPVQLYEAGFNFLMCAVLLAAHARKKFAGQTVLLYFMLYAAGRFVLEFFRGDNLPLWAGFTLSQVISMGLFAVSAFTYGWIGKNERRKSFKS